MLMESPAGETRIVEVDPRVVCYVPPFWIHRSVNVGPDDLVMTFAYPADAGQDYGIIERSGGMAQRIVRAGGWWMAGGAERLLSRPHHRRGRAGVRDRRLTENPAPGAKSLDLRPGRTAHAPLHRRDDWPEFDPCACFRPGRTCSGSTP